MMYFVTVLTFVKLLTRPLLSRILDKLYLEREFDHHLIRY